MNIEMNDFQKMLTCESLLFPFKDISMREIEKGNRFVMNSEDERFSYDILITISSLHRPGEYKGLTENIEIEIGYVVVHVNYVWVDKLYKATYTRNLQTTLTTYYFDTDTPTAVFPEHTFIAKEHSMKRMYNARKRHEDSVRRYVKAGYVDSDVMKQLNNIIIFKRRLGSTLNDIYTVLYDSVDGIKAEKLAKIFFSLYSIPYKAP